jgi:hypothetical protein
LAGPCHQALRDTYEEKKKAVLWQEILPLLSAVETLRSYGKDSNGKEIRVKRVDNASNKSDALLIRLDKVDEVLRRIDFLKKERKGLALTSYVKIAKKGSNAVQIEKPKIKRPSPL